MSRARLKLGSARAEEGVDMRNIGIRTQVLLALAAAAGLFATLGRPWYAAAPAAADEQSGMGDIHGPLNAFFDGARRWVTDPDGTSGWTALDHAGVALAAMAGLAALGALLCLLPSVPALGRDLLRYGAIAVCGVVAWKLVDSPGPNDEMELRNGALAAAGCAIVLLTCAMSVANARVARKAPPSRSAAPRAFDSAY
jgi:hypothetical protein